MLKIARSAYRTSVKSKSLSKNFHSSSSLKSSDSFLGGSNSVYLEQMYELWTKDKNSVHPSWNAYFTNITNGLSGDQAFVMPPSVTPSVPQQQGTVIPRAQTSYSPTSISAGPQKGNTHSFRIYKLVQAYMRRGHERAEVDPLGNYFCICVYF
jgi:2-oxoglutarate dehydrogenase E1 component